MGEELGFREEDTEHAAKGFGGAPEELVANGEGGEVAARIHGEGANTPDGDAESAIDRGRVKTRDGGFAGIGDEFDPWIAGGDELFDLFQGRVLAEADGERLAVAAHGTNTNTEAIDDDAIGMLVRCSQDLVAFDIPFPFFAGHSIPKILIDPRDEATSEGGLEVFGGELGGSKGLGDLGIDIEDRALGIGEIGGDGMMQRAHLQKQFAHVGSPGTGGGLVGHGGDPLDAILAEEAVESHHHETDGAIAADEGFGSLSEGLVDDVLIERVENNDGILVHAEGGCGIDPVAIPTSSAEERVDALRVVATLAADDGLHGGESIDGEGVEQGLAIRAWAARVGGAEVMWVDEGEVLFLFHALHEDRADHTAPTDQTDFHATTPCWVRDEV